MQSLQLTITNKVSQKNIKSSPTSPRPHTVTNRPSQAKRELNLCDLIWHERSPYKSHNTIVVCLTRQWKRAKRGGFYSRQSRLWRRCGQTRAFVYRGPAGSSYFGARTLSGQFQRELKSVDIFEFTTTPLYHKRVIIQERGYLIVRLIISMP